MFFQHSSIDVCRCVGLTLAVLWEEYVVHKIYVLFLFHFVFFLAVAGAKTSKTQHTPRTPRERHPGAGNRRGIPRRKIDNTERNSGRPRSGLKTDNSDRCNHNNLRATRCGHLLPFYAHAARPALRKQRPARHKGSWLPPHTRKATKETSAVTDRFVPASSRVTTSDSSMRNQPTRHRTSLPSPTPGPAAFPASPPVHPPQLRLQGLVLRT